MTPKTIDELKRQLKSIERTIGITVNVSQIGQLPRGITQYTEAIGGPVYPGQKYTWQEPGREGELLVPEQYGRVLSNHEVAQVMRDAMMGAGAGNGGNGGNKPQVINNYNYVLNMPTSNSPSDVAMAYELMQALGG